MATTHLEFLTKKREFVSMQYTEGMTTHQQRSTLMAETLHNEQGHNVVVDPSDTKEVMTNANLTAANNRSSQAPILSNPTRNE